MKSKLVPAVLVLICLGLGTGWFLNSKKAEETRIQMEGQQSALSNDLVATTGKLTEQVRVNATLETNLSQRIEDLNTVSNKWVATSGELTRTSAEAAKAAATNRWKQWAKHSMSSSRPAISCKQCIMPTL